MARRQRAGFGPEGLAVAGRVAGDVKDILGGESQAGERAAGRARQRYRFAFHEGAERILHLVLSVE